MASSNQLIASLTVTILVTLCTTFADLITSTVKLQQLPLLEEELLARVQVYERGILPHQFHEQEILRQYESFFKSRREQVDTLKQGSTAGWHPNDMYHLIKSCAVVWPHILRQLPDLATQTSDLGPMLPKARETSSACMALVRLQLVYKLKVEDMLQGDYLGFRGLPLSYEDAYDIGKQAFVDGFFAEAVPWLEKATSATRESVHKGESTPESRYKFGQILGLLGRSFILSKARSKAEELYDNAEQHLIDRRAPDFVQLESDLTSGVSTARFIPEVKPYEKNLSLLCTRDKLHQVSQSRPFHVCRYHSGLNVPYYRFKEEILALSPFVSIFYEVIYDGEIQTFKNLSVEKLQDGYITRNERKDTELNYQMRTSKLHWLYDTDSPVVRRVSNRLHGITGLALGYPDSGEPFQVVNYGLGGHYYAHFDPFEADTHYPYNPSGNRLATVLLYLSDVDIGGATVFLRAGISVAPIKGAALLWYNYDPSIIRNELTFHAGCPVVKGHKWIANKWIWTKGNMFNRPCGPSLTSTHCDVEHFLFPKK